ncbi:MAG: hypothetical protein PV344_06505 [Anaplasma sp.]|nr:hypothetical protein [Anaplasma sp.]
MNRLRFAKDSSREQLDQYENTTEATFDSRKFEPAKINYFAVCIFKLPDFFH